MILLFKLNEIEFLSVSLCSSIQRKDGASLILREISFVISTDLTVCVKQYPLPPSFNVKVFS